MHASDIGLIRNSLEKRPAAVFSAGGKHIQKRWPLSMLGGKPYAAEPKESVSMTRNTIRCWRGGSRVDATIATVH
jgi:hypothetical protein